jgi:hypothetical protein
MWNPATLPEWARAGVVLLAGGLLPLAGRADPWRPHLAVEAVWHDNASNANRPADEIEAFEMRSNLAFSHRLALARNDSLHFTAQASADWWPRFTALQQPTLGGSVEWQHKFGLGAQAPVVGLEVLGASVLASDRNRRGTLTRTALTLRKRFNDIWRATLSQDISRHDARLAVYDRQGAETALTVDRPLGQTWHLAVRGSYRDGDVLSHGTPPRPDLVALAPNRTPVTTFDRPMVAYAIDASSIAGEATLSRALGARSSLSLGFTHRVTRRTPLRYVNNFVSAGFGHQF